MWIYSDQLFQWPRQSYIDSINGIAVDNTITDSVRWQKPGAIKTVSAVVVIMSLMGMLSDMNTHRVSASVTHDTGIAKL